MLDYAASRQPPDTRIKWRQADALALPFENATFDLVCCQFGAMFFPDRTSGYREERAVDFGGIEECDAAFHRRPDQRNSRLLIDCRAAGPWSPHMRAVDCHCPPPVE
jgi:ubiquinone/menaquinone biosynthesis C-methylase UbiE